MDAVDEPEEVGTIAYLLKRRSQSVTDQNAEIAPVEEDLNVAEIPANVARVPVIWVKEREFANETEFGAFLKDDENDTWSINRTQKQGRGMKKVWR